MGASVCVENGVWGSRYEYLYIYKFSASARKGLVSVPAYQRPSAPILEENFHSLEKTEDERRQEEFCL